MIRLKNRSINEILQQKKKLVIYGASKNLGNMIRFFNAERIEKHIEFVVDRDEKKDGRKFSAAGFTFPIVSLTHFQKMKNICSSYQMIIVIEQYLDVIECLDRLPELDGMQCDIWWIPFLAGHSGKTLGEKLVLPPARNYDIPRMIHYCWFGGHELTDEAKRCIQSWRDTCPGFEIKEWNETNFDVEAVPYIKDAYKSGQFSFVSDYARYDIISRYGGFYFDTDVKLLRNIQDLCSYRGFFSFEYYNLLNSGSGFAAQKGDAVIMELRERYYNRNFLKEDLSFNLKPCSEYETEYFKEKGVRIDDSFQDYEGFLIFPHEFFAPVNQVEAILELTENTYGIHGFECAWLPKEIQMNWDRKKENIRSINERLIKAWKEDQE